MAASLAVGIGRPLRLREPLADGPPGALFIHSAAISEARAEVPTADLEFAPPIPDRSWRVVAQPLYGPRVEVTPCQDSPKWAWLAVHRSNIRDWHPPTSEWPHTRQPSEVLLVTTEGLIERIVGAQMFDQNIPLICGLCQGLKAQVLKFSLRASGAGASATRAPRQQERRCIQSAGCLNAV